MAEGLTAAEDVRAVRDFLTNVPSGVERGARAAVVGAAGVAVLVGWGRIVAAPVGDFPRHWVFGERFVNHEFLYSNGLNVPYPPFWAMAHAPLTLIPVHLAQILVYPFATLALICLLWTLDRVTSTDLPVERKAVFWIAAGAVLLSVDFVARDFVECGPNITLVAATWIGLACWRSKRVWTGAALIGCAIALKLTAALFIPYFFLRRQWRMGLATAFFAALFTVMPAVWQGRASYLQHLQVWATNVRAGIAAPDPRYGILGLEKYSNISLRPALTRYLTHIPELPEGEARSSGLGRYVHPLNMDVLTLPLATTRWILNASTICLIAIVLWSLRGRVAGARDPRVVWEAAAVGVLALLLSPITWKQHLVAVVPACYLIARYAASRGELPRVAQAAVGFIVVSSIVLSRGLMGVEVSSLVSAYHLHTVGLLILLAAILRCRTLMTPAFAGPILTPG